MAEPSRVPDDGSPLREIPGLRKRERTWKDEVRERVEARQRKRSAERGEPDPPSLEASESDPPPRKKPRIRPFEPAVLEPRRVELGPAPAPSADPDPPEAAFDDLPLQGEDPVDEAEVEPLAPPPLPAAAGPRFPEARAETGIGEIAAEDEDDDGAGWELDLEPPTRPREGVERPAPLGTRSLAAGIDALLLGSLYGVVVYFASRASQSSPSALAAAWPWLVGYMLLLGLAYAGCFTGFTGQTPGKMWTGIRVVDGSGRAPGVWYAVLRAAAAVVGIAAGGAGLIPVVLDPARRATHDRLLGTRVVTR